MNFLRMVRLRWCVCLVPVLLAFSGCVSAPQEPRNLAAVKRDLRSYANGDYLRQVEVVAKEATQWIRTRSATKVSEKLLVVFDLDETLLSNQKYFDMVDWGYTSGTWHDWNMQGEASVLQPVKEVYAAALQSGVAVAFISGRREKTRSGIVKNLEAVGCGNYVALRLRPDDERGSVIPFKTRERRQLVEAGYTIIANIGDQVSDLEGGFSEKTFRVPNPFYEVP